MDSNDQYSTIIRRYPDWQSSGVHPLSNKWSPAMRFSFHGSVEITAHNLLKNQCRMYYIIMERVHMFAMSTLTHYII